jgi:cardiolipin synthase
MSLSDNIIRCLADAIELMEARHGIESPDGDALASRLSRLLGATDEIRVREFLDSSRDRLRRTVSDARVVVTGREWIGGSAGAVDTALLTLLASAEREILATIYSFGWETDAVFDTLEDRAAAGVRVGLVVENLIEQPPPVKARLSAFAGRFEHCDVVDFAKISSSHSLHAKAFVIDRKYALIGSANVSRSGFVHNHEMAVVMEGSVVDTAADRIDTLLALARRTP